MESEDQMAPSGFGDDATSIVDEELLAEIRAEVARRAQATGTDATNAPSADPSPYRHEAESVVAADHGDLEAPLVEGYGALREIGRGGFSRVYEALQFNFERWVAVKVLNETLGGEDEAAEFERECRLMGVLSRHPNIVTVLESTFTAEGLPCIAMELFPDGSYLDVLQATGPLGLEELLSVAVSISGALATAHRQGVVHGDIKPQNIFRSEFGAALGDFGIASLVNHGFGPAKTRLSLYYAAPEVIQRGASALSPFSDQYSLAATLYTLATGERPFHADETHSTRELIVEALTAPVPRLGDEFSAKLADALQQAMDHEPGLRHRDMRTFAAAIGEVEAELGYRPTELRIITSSGRYAAQIPGQSSRDLSISRDAERATPDRTGPHATGPRDLSADLGNTTIVRPPLPAAQPPQQPPPKSTRGRRTRRILIATAAIVLLAAGGAAAFLALGDSREDQSPVISDPEPSAGDVSELPVAEVSEPQPEPQPEAPPAALGEIRVDGQRNGFVVRWETAPDANPPILFYRVQWRGSDQSFSEAQEMLVDPDQTSAVIDSLASDTEYTVRVAAENAQGAGGWTESGGFTVPDGVPDPPTLRVSPLEEGLAVEWNEPWDGGWPITAYVVEWEDSGGKIQEFRYAALSSSAEILDLIGGEAYRVRVAAENENGRGGWVEETAIAAVSVPAVPGGLAVVESYRGLRVTWEDPPAGGPRITEYRVELSDPDSSSIREVSVSPDDRSADFTDLASGKLHEVLLYAVNGDALSEPALADGVPLDRIAFVSDFEGVDAIYYANVTRRDDHIAMVDHVRVTDSDIREREGSPSWSPDGKWIAFQRRHPDDTHWQIFIKNLESGSERQLICGRDNGWSPSWSPDGLTIAFTRGSRGNDIWTMNVETGESQSLKDVYDKDDAYPSWAPDGNTLAFARKDYIAWRSSRWNPREIRILTGIGAELGVEWLTKGYEDGDYNSPMWLPSGDEIAYSIRLRNSNNRHIDVMDIHGTKLRQLTTGESHDSEPDWSHDGELIAFARVVGDSRDLYVVNSAGGEPAPLLENGAFDYWAPSWSPSGDVSVDPTFDCGS